MVDESNLFASQYFHTLVGVRETPHVSFLYNCQPLSGSPNADSIVQAIKNAVKSRGTNRNFLSLLLSDAARYMVAVGTVLKSLYPKLFHVTCIAHS